MDEGRDGRRFSVSAMVENIPIYVRERAVAFQASLSKINSESISNSIRKAPNSIKRNLLDSSVTDIITKVPAVTVVMCLAVTGFFSLHSGVNALSLIHI